MTGRKARSRWLLLFGGIVVIRPVDSTGLQGFDKLVKIGQILEVARVARPQEPGLGGWMDLDSVSQKVESPYPCR